MDESELVEKPSGAHIDYIHSFASPVGTGNAWHALQVLYVSMYSLPSQLGHLGDLINNYRYPVTKYMHMY